VKMEEFLRSPLFRQVLFDVQNGECEQLEAELALNPVQVSPAFERRMQKLIRAERKPYYRFINTNGKKAVLALAATLILFVTMVFSVSALREPTVRFFMDVYEKFSQVFYRQHEQEQFPSALEIYYAPTKLPDGYRLEADQTVDAIVYYEMTYVSDSKDDIVFKQYAINPSASRVDTEGSETKPITVNGSEGIFFTNKGVQHIQWNEKYKGEAKLQKRFTVDFLTKTQKVNEGEVPQYYVRNSHPAIIEPELFDLVQCEMKCRQQSGK